MKKRCQTEAGSCRRVYSGTHAIWCRRARGDEMSHRPNRHRRIDENAQTTAGAKVKQGNKSLARGCGEGTYGPRRGTVKLVWPWCADARRGFLSVFSAQTVSRRTTGGVAPLMELLQLCAGIRQDSLAPGRFLLFFFSYTFNFIFWIQLKKQINIYLYNNYSRPF